MILTLVAKTDPAEVELPNGEKEILTEEDIKETLKTYKEREDAHQRNRRTAFKVLETQ